MENKTVSSFKTALNYGLITAVLLIVFGLILFLMDVDFESLRTIGYFSYIIIIVLMILGILAQKKAQGGFITYGKAFTVGFLIILISAIISSIYQYFYFTSIDPGMAEEIMDFSMANSEQRILEMNPDASQAEIDQAMSYAESMSTPVWMVIWGFVSNVVIGTILSLILPIFMMKKNPAEA